MATVHPHSHSHSPTLVHEAKTKTTEEKIETKRTLISRENSIPNILISCVNAHNKQPYIENSNVKWRKKNNKSLWTVWPEFMLRASTIFILKKRKQHAPFLMVFLWTRKKNFNIFFTCFIFLSFSSFLCFCHAHYDWICNEMHFVFGFFRIAQIQQ